MLRRALQHRSFLLGVILVGLMVAAALISLIWTPYAPERMRVGPPFAGPSWAHWLGTDSFGRDTFSRVIVGAQNSIMVGVVAVGIGLIVGVPLGIAAAAYRGWWDEVLGRMVDLTFAFPAILTAVMITALMGPGAVNSILAIGIFNIAVFARVSRGAALQVYGREFPRAALALGRGRSDIAIRHILPNIASALIVQATIQFAIAILAEAALSYLGFGTQPPHPSWGKMLLDAQSMMWIDWTQAIYPGVAIALAVLGLNLLGDGLRDLLDPRLRVFRVG
ncbi:MAG: ABC transporter permease [Pseudomonadota bacterium]